jgi:hypothetical protein
MGRRRIRTDVSLRDDVGRGSCGNRDLDEARRWLTQALHDRDAARLNHDHGFHEHARFLAQQSAEKALKAFL